ncbi:MAG: RNA-binding protein [Vibrio sp.]
MKSKNSTLLVIVLAVLGTALFYSLNTIHPAISFLIGVVATALLFTISKPTQSQASTEKAPTQTLYVGNLPYKANESNVRQLFSEYGEVFAVRLMKDKRTGKRRGFGFVVVAESDADSVIAQLNEKDYMQRTLKVRVANDPKHPEAGESELD